VEVTKKLLHKQQFILKAEESAIALVSKSVFTFQEVSGDHCKVGYKKTFTTTRTFLLKRKFFIRNFNYCVA